jgi:serine/threonine-protein kinase
MTEPTERPSRVGEILADKYRIVRYLGEGGMGTVYEAQHAFVGRRFAVKILHAELTRADEILERFTREARAAGALENENIASVIDFGHTGDGVPYIVMEYLVGEDLARLLAREGQLPVPRAVNMIVQACRGLDAAHAAGVIHRDLKPENLFVCKRGDGSDLLKLLDFGIAKLAKTSAAGAAGGEGPPPSVTRSGTAMGTPYYMPPEQAKGAKDLDHRADIYALGVILYEALSGQRPHPGDSYNGILYHILTQPVVPLGSLRKGLDRDLTDVVHRALAFDPSDRPRSAVELARALAPHAGRQITPMRSQFELRAITRPSAPTSPPDLAPADEAVQAGWTLPLTSTEPPGLREEMAPAPRRRFGRAGLAAAGVVAVGVSLAVWQAASRTASSPPGAPAPNDESVPTPSVEAKPPPPSPALLPSGADGGVSARAEARPAGPSPATSSPGRPPSDALSSKRGSHRPRARGNPAPAARPTFDKANPYR